MTSCGGRTHAGQAARLLNPVTKERGTRPHFQVVDITVQRRVHSETSFAMLLNLHPTIFAMYELRVAESDVGHTLPV